MKKITYLLLLMTAVMSLTHGQVQLPPYHFRNDFLHASSGALKYGLYGFDNPALLTYVKQGDLYFTWSDQDGSLTDFYRWGLFAAVPNLGFGMVQQETRFGSITDYRISSAYGNRTVSAGFGFGWSGGATEEFNREKVFSLGLLFRPSRYISVGTVGYQTLRGKRQEAYIDAAFRPLGSEVVTVFADFAMQNDQSVREGIWSAGAVFEVVPGIRVSGRYFESEAFTAGIQLSLGRLGFTTQSHYNADRKHAYNTYGVRLGAYDRNIFDSYFSKKERYLNLNLNGTLRYQRFRLFDRSNTLMDILRSIDEAANDPSIAGIAINLSDMRASRTMRWELREKLKEFRATGKHVVVYFDRAGIDDYHLASVADRIIMDPEGMLTLEGYLMGRTYLKGALEKIGIGFDEWRFFTHKSAMESYSREKMSDADREQRQKLIDDQYRLVRHDITGSRKIGAEEFDRLVNEEAIFLPHQAIEYGLIDTTGRWEEVQSIIESLEGKKKKMTGPGRLAARNLPIDNHWSEPPKIAVIYALGVCAMDEGITARKLVKDVERAARNNKVKAIVFRVDSPGGDGMASDIVAEALRKAMEKKPVIVSQGQVAASGGYWLSMYSDTIVAAPNTITGSIGVIGGWMYNNGLKEKLGLTTDYVKVGTYADLGFGFILPYLNIGLPDRNLTEDEYNKMEYFIKHHYERFVEKVADGRDTEPDKIEPYAQGRVWSGYDGLDIGLVDVLGGLDDAIRIAKEKAGIARLKEVSLVEYPQRGLFDASMFAPRFFGVDIKNPEPLIEHLRFRLEHNGLPLPVLPLDFLSLEYITHY
jgi:protease IV